MGKKVVLVRKRFFFRYCFEPKLRNLLAEVGERYGPPILKKNQSFGGRHSVHYIVSNQFKNGRLGGKKSGGCIQTYERASATAVVVKMLRGRYKQASNWQNFKSGFLTI